MSTFFWLAVLIGLPLYLGYTRASLSTATIAGGVALAVYWLFGDGGLLLNLLLLIPIVGLVALIKMIFDAKNSANRH